jgi:hypothetical protein
MNDTVQLTVPSVRLLKALSDSIVAKTYAEIECASLAHYRFWQVEPLLNQAMEILNRCKGARKEVDDYWIQLARLKLELKSDQNLTEISDQEDHDDFDKREYNYLTKQLDGMNTTLAQKHSFGDGTIDGLTQAELKQKVVENAQQAMAMTAGVGGWDADTSHYQSKESKNSAAANYLAHRCEVDLLSWSQNQALLAANRRAAAKQREAAIRSAKIDYSKPFQPLDFETRINRITEFQLKPDLEDAAMRCIAARKGLTSIFGWADVAEVPSIGNSDEDGFTYIDRLWDWTANAMRWMSKFGQHDQNFTVCISIGPLELGRSAEFEFEEQLFSQFRFVRIRGVSVFVQTNRNNDSALFRVQLNPPRIGRIHTARQHICIDQSVVPPCILGRSTHQGHAQPCEVGGNLSLLNVTPLGEGHSKWAISVTPATRLAFEAEISDVQICLVVAGNSL